MTYILTDHVCRFCLGRVLKVDGERRYRCADCGAEGEGSVKSVCCCGAKLANGRSAGMVCEPNPARSEQAPCEVSVRFVAERFAQPAE